MIRWLREPITVTRWTLLVFQTFAVVTLARGLLGL